VTDGKLVADGLMASADVHRRDTSRRANAGEGQAIAADYQSAITDFPSLKCAGDLDNNIQELQMSIFGNIVTAIFGRTAASTAAAKGTPTVAGPAATGTPMTEEQVEEMIEKLASAQDEQYNWEESIVDLMKLLKLDSSLGARKKLGQELGYTGALDGSAEMNIWLHKQVMTKLAESGGVVPASLQHA
jgi:hypothetical protein